MKKELCISSKARKVDGSKDVFQLREPQEPYNTDFDTEMWDIGSENGYLWAEG